MEKTINKYNCDICNYNCIYPSHWKQHIESERHKNNGIRKPRSDKVLEPKCKHYRLFPNPSVYVLPWTVDLERKRIRKCAAFLATPEFKEDVFEKAFFD